MSGFGHVSWVLDTNRECLTLVVVVSHVSWVLDTCRGVSHVSGVEHVSWVIHM